MSGPTAVEVDGDVSDLIAMLTGVFPGWHITRTERGWWAVRGGVVRESLVPDGRTTVTATSPAALYVLLEDAARR